MCCAAIAWGEWPRLGLSARIFCWEFVDLIKQSQPFHVIKPLKRDLNVAFRLNDTLSSTVLHPLLFQPYPRKSKLTPPIFGTP